MRLADCAGSAFAQQIAGVLVILEQLHAAELQRVNDLLSEIRTAAMVLTDDGQVVATNDAARAAFGLEPGGSLRSMPLDGAGLAELTERVAEVAAEESREEIVQLRPSGLDRLLMVHLKAMPSGSRTPQVMAITSELVWPEKVSEFLARVFALTGAEIEVMRLLTAGGTVAGIARATRRSPGTVRSQLHAILEKTGTRSQAEAVRLAMLLLESVRVEAEPRRASLLPEPHQRFLRMPDGRRIEVLTFGDPAGRPVIWMSSSYGYFRLPRAAEADLTRRGLRMLVPFRAGYCGSDPPSTGCDRLEVAVADLRTLMARLRIASAPVVAPADDLRIALMLAQAEPTRVRHVIGVGAAFPILTEAQYRRLVPVARFVRACARYSPKVLPFMIRVLRASIARAGIEPYLRGTYARTPADARAFAQPEVAEANVAGVDYMFFRDGWSEAAFCAEMVLFHQDWPPDLGHVACPVTLIHGEQDGNCPAATALEYCAMYPHWRYIGYPDEGTLVAHVRWRDVFDRIEQAFGPTLPDAPDKVLPASE
jgi:pimeloyl-ACP methyl ester carboxylesterase/DNA-binding CsgD family transcriptional regulator